MDNNLFLAVSKYINENVFHSSVWDEAEEIQKIKAVNNSISILLNVLKKYYSLEDDISVDVLAHQTVWFMRIDDTFLRAEMGATYIQMAGVMVNIKDKDRSIAPYVIDKLSITPDAITGGVTRRKVGTYTGRKVGTSDSIYRKE